MELTSNKKFLLGFTGVVLVVFLLLILQIRKNFTITTTHVQDPLIALQAIDIPIDQSESLLGNPGAPITLISYLDFGNQANRLLYKTLADTVRKHPRELRLVFKHSPYSSFWFESTHTTIHEAIFCASQQGKLWAYADQLANISTLWRNKQLSDAASATNLNPTTFADCLESNDTKTKLEAAVVQSKSIAPNPPTVFANNKQLNLTTDVDLQQLLESFIAP